MRLFAEEKRTGTIELLTTSPIRDGEVILGKWLAALTLYVCILLVTGAELYLSFQVRQSRIGSRWRSTILDLLLQAAALLAIGTFISTLTKNQIIAGAATFGVCLLIFVLRLGDGIQQRHLGAGLLLHFR